MIIITVLSSTTGELLAHMDEAGLRRVLALYGMAPQRFFEVQKGYRNSSHPIQLQNGQMVNLILYKNEPGIVARIKRANVVADTAAAHGVPARATVDGRIIRLKTPTGENYASLYRYLPGDTIEWEHFTKAHIKLVGLGLGRLHAALGQATHDAPSAALEYEQLVRRMQGYFTEPAVQRALLAKLALVVPSEVFADLFLLLRLCRALPNQQLVHMDFVRGNLLFRRATLDDVLVVGDWALSGMIDFEKVARGPVFFDLARTLAFLLVDSSKPEAKIRKYFLESGYIRRAGQQFGRLSIDGREIFEGLISLFLVYDLYKFLRHNPYEFLLQNHHFVRTRDILRARKVLL